LQDARVDVGCRAARGAVREQVVILRKVENKFGLWDLGKIIDVVENTKLKFF